MNQKTHQIAPINVSETKQKEEIKTPSFWISTRFLLSIVMFFGYMINYMQRSNMSIAVVCMVNSTAILELDDQYRSGIRVSNVTTQDSQCSEQFSHKIIDGKFVWSKADQGLILSSYFYGYLITQVNKPLKIPGGWLAMRFGGRMVVFYSMLIPSILTILTPTIANLNHPSLLIVLRFIIGLIHGLMFSAAAFLFAQWSPNKEKGRLIGFSQAGTSFGSVVASIFGGYLCEFGFYEGWGSIFILFGGFGIVWLFMLLIFTSDSPLNHGFISQTEKNYIISNIPAANVQKKRLRTPWKAIFTSKACLVAFVANFCANFGAYLFLTQTPTYMKDVLKFDIKANGLYSSFPFLAAFLVVIISSYVSDKLVSHQVISVITSRKLFNSLGMLVPMICMILLMFIDCSKPLFGVALLTIGVGMLGCLVGSGFVVNLNEIGGRNYSGVLYGISNTFGTLPGIIAPYFVGLITPQGTIEQWRIVFIVTALFYFLGAVPFLIFARVEVEKWAIVESVELEENKLEKSVYEKNENISI